MTTDFPPIGVVKEGDDVSNSMKSDPDDMQSMVRFLLYANEFDIEGLVASAGTFTMVADKNNILNVLDEYEKVYNNLKTYDPDYPTTDYLRSVTYEGRANNHGLSITWGCGKQDYTEIIGDGLDSEASNAIIAAADKPDPRPLWIGIWGGPREVAQAIWDVKNTRSKEELNIFIRKLRVHLIYCQDATHEWLMNEFPDLFIIESKNTYQGMFGGHDPVSDLAWVNKNIRFNHGPLCEVYPHEGMGSNGVCEGDSPTFLHLVSANRGINDPEYPTQPSWGGQFVRKANTNQYVDGPGKGSISRWRNDFQKEFKERADRCLKPKSEASYTKPRIINTTDLGADPDDDQSMVRQLVSANEFDIEGLIVSTGCWIKSQSNTDMLDKIIDAYEEVYYNLTVHAEGYPTPEYLRSISVMGQTGYGMSDVGTGKESPGSELIIASVDKDDPRPVWVMGWGGMNNAAQAIWKVRENRSPEELEKFLSKLRLFDILGQDDAGTWIAKNFPDVFYIRATYGVFGWPPDDDWLREYVQSKGPLGEVYPDRAYSTEGDSPAFLHVFPNGLNDPEKVFHGGWGGRFAQEKKAGIRGMQCMEGEDEKFDPYFMYGDAPEGQEAIKRWSIAINNDFRARMDWSVTPNYSKANHQPIAVVNGNTSRQVLYVSAVPGSNVTLDAAGSSDPDSDSLIYNWSFYDEPSSYDGSVAIDNSSSPTAKLVIPEDAAGMNLHIILEIHDSGTPNLHAYRRVIINVQPTSNE